MNKFVMVSIMTARGPRYEAKQRGEPIYWTGKPCKRGHIDFRRTDNGNCCECDRDVQRPRTKARYDADPARAIAYSTQYRKDHLPQVQKRLRGWRAHKRQTDIQWRLREYIRKITNAALRANKRRLIIGCTGAQFRQWLEEHFTPGMTWENYATVWTLDHTKPLKAFDLTDPQQFSVACHYTNVLPMLRADNIRKSDKRPRPRG